MKSRVEANGARTRSERANENEKRFPKDWTRYIPEDEHVPSYLFRTSRAVPNGF